MTFYLSVAVVASALSAFAQRLEKGHRIAAFLVYVSVVVLFCYFAGARDITIGTDTAGYGYDSYRAASTTSLPYFFFEGQFSDWSPLYKFVLWLTCYFTDGFFWNLFIIQLLTIAPTLTACRRSSGSYLPLAIICYALLFYPLSFNLMRQMVSMGILLLSYRYAEEGRLAPFVVVVLIATGFHSTAVLGVLVYPPVRYFCSGDKSLSDTLKMTFVSVVALALMAVAPRVLSLVASVGYYDAYVTGRLSEAGGLGLFFITSGVYAVLVVLGWLFSRAGSRSMSGVAPLGAVVLFGDVCLLLSLLSGFLWRVGFYYLFFCLLLIPKLCASVEDRGSRTFLVGLAVTLVFVWSLHYYEITGAHEVIPYVLSSVCL